MRIDKWLWAARFFKTRSIATHACELGRIESNGQACKPAREVKIGDVLKIKNPGGEFVVDVMALSDVRGPAAVAQTLYQETDASKAARLLAAEARKSAPQFDWDYEGRPSKKDRRVLTKLRGR